MEPPRPSHRVALLGTAVVLVAWLVLTLGAGPLAPLVGDLLEWGEVGLGLDVSRGTRTLEDSR